MRTFHQIINERRQALGLSYRGVVEALAKRDWPEGIEPPEYPTVAHWFNGKRKPRDMQHLRALCDVLDLSVDEAVAGGTVEAVTATETVAIELLRQLGAGQQELILGLMRSMASKGENQ